MTSPLTEQEKAVQEARGRRPPRNLQKFIIIGVSGLFLGAALVSYVKTGGKAQVPVADRAGPRPDVTEAPRGKEFADLIAKQSDPERGQPKSTPAEASPFPLPPEKSAGDPALKSILPMPTTPPAAAQAVPQPYGAMAPSGPRTAPLDMANLPQGARPYPAAGTQAPEVTEGQLREAAHMLEGTSVYRRQRSQQPIRTTDPGATRDPQSVPGLDAAIAQLTGSKTGTDPMARLDSLRSGLASNVDDRIAKRQDRAQSFANSQPGAAPQVTEVVSPHSLPLISIGTMLPAVLVREVSTDLPGQIEARITQDVYDSHGRGKLLVPKGSRVIGVYNSAVSVGQARLQAAFTRLEFPNGATIDLGNAASADTLGGSGIPGEVNNHFFRIFGSALAIAGLTYAVERRVAQDARTGNGGVIVSTGAAATPGTVATQAFTEVGKNVLDRHQNIGPTIFVPAGTRINIQIAKDLAIDPRRIRG